ncbi:MAG: Hpt domain-containing protein [Pseudomonadales bacterium]|nr:Hpt domain-containing protein [Pseudomonadales bacterium]
MPELVKDFESRRDTTLNVSALAAIADALSSGEQPPSMPNSLYIGEESVSDVSDVLEEDVVENLVEDQIEEIAPTDDIEPLATMDDIEPIEAADMLVAEDVIDPVLLDIFSQEARSHLEVVREFLKLAEQSSQSFTSPLLRALHTLKGSAHMAGIHVIADLASPTEKFIKECHLQGLETDTEIHQFLASAVDLIENGVEQLTTTPTMMIEGTEAFVELAEELRQRKLVHAEEAENADDMVVPDPQLVSIFLAEGTDLILDAADVLNHWEQNPVPGKDLDNLRRELRILSRSASAAQLNDVVALCMALEETYNAMSEGMLTPGAEFFEIAHRAHEHLIGMMYRIAVGQKPMGVDALVGELQSLVDQAPEVAEQIEGQASEESEEVNESEEAIEDEASEFEFDTEAETSSLEYEEIDELDELESPEEVAPTVSEDEEEEEEEYDAELVEIFLEEAEEIVESISNLLEEWRSEPDNLDKVAQLQRDLHTLKGGARMSDMTEIGDLAHHLENLYEGLCDKKFVAIPSLFSILNECHDTLAIMVEALQSGQPLIAANGLIKQVEAYMAGDTEFESLASNMTEDITGEELAPTSASVEAANEPELVQQDENALEALSSDDDGEEIDIEILEVFMEEASELIEGLDTTVSALQGERDSQEHVDELKRLLHTFKGGARLAGLKLLGDISHDFETFLIEQEALIEQEERTEGFGDASLSTIQGYQDKLIEQVDLVRQRGSELLEEAALPGQVFDKPQDKPDSPRKITGEDNVVPITPQPEPGESIIIHDAVAGSAAAVHDSGEKSGSAESIRVSADLIEELVNLSGETSIIRGRVEQELTDFSYEIDDIGMAIDRARELLRRLDIETETQILHGHQTVGEGSDYADFDPLEMDRYSTLHQLSRSLSETASDLMDLKDSLLDRARDTETLLQQQARVNSELQEGLMRTRMVPFSRMVPRLRRIVRQISGEVGKKAELEVIGADGEMDRTVMDRMISPLEHMIRNAVDHGIETPEERKAAGKEETGRITIHLAREGGDVVLRLMDDGKGINLEAVKTRAIERGLMKVNAPLTEKEIMQFIFKAGFSTAEKVTQISGRGVGMDVVHSEIKQLGGNLKIHSAPNAGSQFTVRLPFTVSVNRALMVRVGEDAYAIPLNNIEGIVRVSPYELDAYYQPDSPDFEYAGESYRLRYLGRYVHGVQSPDLQSHVKPLPVLLVRGADHAVALQVDSLVGSREIVVKSVGPQLSAVSGISGATILGDGSVVIILDLNAMIRADHAQLSIDGTQEVVEEVVVETTPTVMVIDDSVTVRKVTTRLLERHGFDVVTAKDGVDAITQLQDIKPDIMLLDIEMPRMDGFEVATLVRHDERLRDTPIIMITSRTGEKHRERAVSIGVNGYMGKPYQETTLLKEIEALLKRPS